MSVQSNVIIVIYVSDLEVSREFYDTLGFDLQKEQHGNGPIHYSAQLEQILIELYPKYKATSHIRLGLKTSAFTKVMSAIKNKWGLWYLLQESESAALLFDPDENIIHLEAA